MGRKKTFQNQLREAIDASGLSRYRICKTVGMEQGLMSRFMRGNAGLGLATVDAICELLHLELRAAKSAKGK